MARAIAGPFRSERFTANTIISPKSAWLGTYTVANASASPVTVSFYDDPTGGTANLIEQIIIGAGQNQAIYPNGDTLYGLNVQASVWTSLNVFVRWAPK